MMLPLLWWGFDVRAQVSQGTSSMPEQWQLTLDMIKSKAHSLMVENNGLKDEYWQLISEVENLKQSIDDQRMSNIKLEHMIKERHGQTDQQLRITELTQVLKIKRQEARTCDEKFGNLLNKKSGLDHQIHSLKYMISNIEFQQQAQKAKASMVQNPSKPPVDDQLDQLRKRLEAEIKQEVLLENELAALKNDDKNQNRDADAMAAENKQLEARLDILRLQKLQPVEKSSDTRPAQANDSRYDQLKKRMDQLEGEISAYELRLAHLRNTSLTGTTWPLKKKKMVHEMVLIDARNIQMRQKIKVLHEDIDVLKDQVAKLERRVDFVKGQAAM